MLQDTEDAPPRRRPLRFALEHLRAAVEHIALIGPKFIVSAVLDLEPIVFLIEPVHIGALRLQHCLHPLERESDKSWEAEDAIEVAIDP